MYKKMFFKFIYPFYRITSAPREVALTVGNYRFSREYQISGAEKQTFFIENYSIDFADFVDLELISNWGHPEVTCLYQVEIH